jgi:hypothetical protein
VDDLFVFTVSVSHGDGVPTYQWWFDESGQSPVTAVGGNDSTLTIDPVTLRSAGQYWCVVTYQETEYTSQSAVLDVAPRLRFTRHPEGGLFRVGQPLTLSVEVTGGFEPLVYQWERDWITIPDAYEANYSIDALRREDEGAYRANVMDAYDDVTQSNLAIVTVEEGAPGPGAAGLALLAGILACASILMLKRKRH